MAKNDLFWCILAYFGRIPTVEIKLRGACFILYFRPPEFLEKYFQPKRSLNSPASVKKSKKSRPRGTPLKDDSKLITQAGIQTKGSIGDDQSNGLREAIESKNEDK